MTKYEEIMAAQEAARAALKPCKWKHGADRVIDLDDEGTLCVEQPGMRYYLDKADQLALHPVLNDLHGPPNHPPAGSGFAPVETALPLSREEAERAQNEISAAFPPGAKAVWKVVEFLRRYAWDADGFYTPCPCSYCKTEIPAGHLICPKCKELKPQPKRKLL